MWWTFVRRLKIWGCRTTPLLMASLNIQRVQIFFLVYFYQSGDVHLEETSLDTIVYLYRMDDTDSVSDHELSSFGHCDVSKEVLVLNMHERP